MSQPQTIPQHFLERTNHYGVEKVALRQKEFGIWREYSWQDSFEQVRDFAMGLMALGIQRGDHIATVGDNDRFYLWAYVAIQAIGAAQVGIFTDVTPKEVAYAASYADCALALAQDQEQVDKFLEIRDQIPQVRHVIYWDDRGLWDYDDPWLKSYDEVQALGRDLVAREPGRFETEVWSGQGEDVAVMCFTSGTTGLPKAAVLTHDALLASSDYLEDIDPRLDTDNHVSLLPLGWIAEHVLGVAAHVTNGIIMNFPEEPETVRQNVREIAPQGILYNSRLWDNLVSIIQVRMNEATWFNRKLYDAFLPVGYKMADKKFNKETVGMGLQLQYKLGDMLVFRPLRDKVGMVNIRSAYTAGSALSPDAMRFFHAIGINLKQIYGSTEVAGGVAMHRDNDIKFASVGQPVPGAEVRISDEGEIQIKSAATFREYYKNPDATDEAFAVDDGGDRWFRTGDAGYIDEDGHIIYLDRVKDMITLAGGEKYSPQFIEGRLKFNPYIQDVMAIGDPTREYVVALVIFNFDNVGQWAEKRGLGYTTFVDLSQKPEVYDLILAAVQEVNASLPESGRVQRFVLMHKEFDADEAEMTRTRKLRRRFLTERYQDIIDAMYAGDDSIRVRAPVRYQDGSEGFVETDVRIMSV